MSKTYTTNDGAYAHIFAYCVPREHHGEMLDVMSKLNTIYKKHGSLGMNLYVWGQTTLFQGFVGIQKQLGATPNDELWLELDSYRNPMHLQKVIKEVGADTEPASLWDRLTTIVSPGRSIAVGEFNRLTA